MDCVRAIDFLCSREKVQQNNIFAEGGSQGGAFALAAAAMSDNRLNAIAIAVPFMGDFPDWFKISSWPTNIATKKKKQLGMSDEQMYRMLSYFDTKNLATLVTCPVYMNFSLQDHTCPPHTNWAAYNNLASTEKKYLTNATLGHTGAPNWKSEYINFFAQHMRSTGDVSPRFEDPPHNNTIYNMLGLPMNGTLSSLPAGIYIQDGRKIAKR